MIDDAPVLIEAYNPAWPGQFESERAMLTEHLAPWLVGKIEHIGSTAVPGLDAKPVIDIMIPVGDLDSSRPALNALAVLGYEYAPYRADIMHWLCKPSVAFRTHHLNLVPVRSQLWREKVAFRDFLRTNAAVAAEYAVLKHRLAELHRFDREAYTSAKSPFVERVLRMANGT